MKIFYKHFLILLIGSLSFHSAAIAQKLQIAAAANLQTVIRVLQADFKNKTGIDADVVTGSSGKLVAQISNGAPYDIFLSADMDFPGTLYKNGFTTTTPVVYATGSLIICSINKLPLSNWQQWLLSDDVKKIAIANPALAPYGRASEEALEKAGILQKIKNKLVYGESISQVNTYITTGVADAGFTAGSLIQDANTPPLTTYTINARSYAPVQQGMVIIKHAADNAAAKKFYQYILSPAAKRIFKKYGYKTAK